MWAALSLLNVSVDLAETTPLRFCWEPFSGLSSSEGKDRGQWWDSGALWRTLGGTREMAPGSWLGGSAPQRPSQVSVDLYGILATSKSWSLASKKRGRGCPPGPGLT